MFDDLVYAVDKNITNKLTNLGRHSREADLPKETDWFVARQMDDPLAVSVRWAVHSLPHKWITLSSTRASIFSRGLLPHTRPLVQMSVGSSRPLNPNGLLSSSRGFSDNSTMPVRRFACRFRQLWSFLKASRNTRRKCCQSAR